MDDLISRQAAIMAVLYGPLGATTIYGRTEQGMTAQKETVQAIRMLPSAERHGHWINHPDDLFPADSMIECSVCHEYEYATANDNFCGNCGAKMDEVE